MTTNQAQHQSRIDTLMERASVALVARRYFETEELCVEALRRARGIADFDRIARIALPLQEARRQKRDLAFDAAVTLGSVFRIDGELPAGRAIVPGCYLVEPPRVGVDGRILREAADARQTPVIVVVREPQSRDGLWPIVAVGPVTVRTKVAPPAPPPPPPRRARSGGSRKKPKPGAAVASPVPGPAEGSGCPLPTPQWFLAANEALGDAAIAACMLRPTAYSQLEALLDHLAAHPDHEKLHQALEDSARRAAREPASSRRSAASRAELEQFEDEMDDEDDDAA